MKIQWKRLAICLALPLAVGGLSGWLTAGKSQAVYQALQAPPLSPPGWVYAVVWPVLYVLMGIALYRATSGDRRRDGPAVALFVAQLLVNFLWPLLFFLALRLGWAAVVAVLLAALVIATCACFFRRDKWAEWLLVPYALWSAFAAYLSVGFWFLN